MKPLTLLSKRLYFGLDALQLRDATGRVLSRVHGIPSDRATVGFDALLEDFRVSSSRGRMLIDEMVQSGILQPLGAGGVEYAITGSFRELAAARFVDPV